MFILMIVFLIWEEINCSFLFQRFIQILRIYDCFLFPLEIYLFKLTFKRVREGGKTEN